MSAPDPRSARTWPWSVRGPVVVLGGWELPAGGPIRVGSAQQAVTAALEAAGASRKPAG